MHRHSFQLLPWLHIHSSLVLCFMSVSKLFILSTLCCIFFTSYHSSKGRSRSCRRRSSSYPCFSVSGKVSSYLLCFGEAQCWHVWGPSSPPNHTCHIQVGMRSGQVCIQVLTGHWVLRAEHRKSSTFLLQILFNLHHSSNKNYSATPSSCFWCLVVVLQKWFQAYIRNTISGYFPELPFFPIRIGTRTGYSWQCRGMVVGTDP